MTYAAVKNSIAGSVLDKNPNLITNKKDKSAHGYGIRSIKNIAGKYNGSVDFKEENGCFVAEIWLKMAN